MTLYYFEELTMREIGLGAWGGGVARIADSFLGRCAFAGGTEGFWRLAEESAKQCFQACFLNAKTECRCGVNRT